MVQSKRVEEWDRIAQLGMWMVKLTTGRRSGRLKIEDFNPWRSTGKSSMLNLRDVQEQLDKMPKRYADTEEELWQQYYKLEEKLKAKKKKAG